MRQFASVLDWEIGYYLRRVSTWIYFSIYAAIGFIFMLLSGGAFREAAAVFGGGGKVLANSPYAIASLEPLIALLGSLVPLGYADGIPRATGGRGTPYFRPSGRTGRVTAMPRGFCGVRVRP